MKPDEHFEAFKYLHAAAVPDDKKIDAMSEAELDEYLAGHGTNVTELNQKIAARKEQFAGRLALLAARKRRLAEARAPQEDLPIPATKDELIQALKARFGEELPMAAQKFRGMDYDELGQLYRDMMSKGRRSTDGG